MLTLHSQAHRSAAATNSSRLSGSFPAINPIFLPPTVFPTGTRSLQPCLTSIRRPTGQSTTARSRNTSTSWPRQTRTATRTCCPKSTRTSSKTTIPRRQTSRIAPWRLTRTLPAPSRPPSASAPRARRRPRSPEKPVVRSAGIGTTRPPCTMAPAASLRRSRAGSGRKARGGPGSSPRRPSPKTTTRTSRRNSDRIAKSTGLSTPP